MNRAIVRALCATNDDARILLSVRKHHHSLPAWLLTYTRFCGRDFFSEATHTITSLDRQEARQAPSFPSRFRASARSARATKMCSTTLTA